jgi:hypothetical protein
MIGNLRNIIENMIGTQEFKKCILTPTPLPEGKEMNPLGCMFNPLMATCIFYSYTWLPSIYILPWLIPLQNTPYLFNLELCREKEKKDGRRKKIPQPYGVEGPILATPFHVSKEFHASKH